jgi:hypothetical protein
VVIVPEVDDPPTVPSTDQVIDPEPALNCCWPVNVRTETLGVTPNPVPVPESATVWGLPGALSVICTKELNAPVSRGAKVTLTVQAPFGARLAGQLFVSPKSAAFPPAMAMPLTESVPPPALVKVTCCAALVDPVAWVPKVRLGVPKLTKGSELPLLTGVFMSD